MKDSFKKRISIFIVFVNILSSCLFIPCKVYAKTIEQAVIDTVQNYNSIKEMQNWDIDDFLNYLYVGSYGFMPNPDAGNNINVLNSLDQYITGKVAEEENKTNNEVTEEDKLNYVKDGINVTDNSVTINQNIRDIINQYSNLYMQSCGYYEAYAFDLRNMTNSLPTTAQYNALKELVGTSNSNINTEYKFCVVWGSYANVAFCPFEDYGLLLRNNVTNWANLNYADTNVYSYANGNTTPVNGGFQKFTWNSVSQNYIQDANPYSSQLANVRVSTRPNQSTNANAFVLSYGEQIVPVFQTSSDATSYGVGIKPYYYNSKTWNDFSSSSGDYTLDNSNINTVTYGDTVTYIQDSYNETGNYPDNSTVNNWIDNSNQNNHNGGGSGSGGGDSGGGSGGDSTGIFDFLSDIGKVLGNLIKNLGNVLTELVSGIAEIITGLFESIPTVFGDFMGGLLGWMPEELRALIILGISAMIIVGIIKIIRG